MPERTPDHKNSRTFAVGIKLWIASGSRAGVFGEGKCRLLEAIARYGSLSKAAIENGISYRKAWGDIKKAESRIGRRLVVKSRGGEKGGTSRLTPFAEELITAYTAFRKDLATCSRRSFRKRLAKFFRQGS